MSSCLIEISDPARPGRPATTRTYIIDPDASNLTDEERERISQGMQPMRDALLERHPTWTEHHVNCALFGLIADFVEDHAAYERVCEQKGLLPL